MRESVYRFELRPLLSTSGLPTAFLECWVTPQYKCWRVISPAGETLREGFKPR